GTTSPKMQHGRRRFEAREWGFGGQEQSKKQAGEEYRGQHWMALLAKNCCLRRRSRFRKKARAAASASGSTRNEVPSARRVLLPSFTESYGIGEVPILHRNGSTFR